MTLTVNRLDTTITDRSIDVFTIVPVSGETRTALMYLATTGKMRLSAALETAFRTLREPGEFLRVEVRIGLDTIATVS